jgi:TDG/mug DNA glycosylase family protein
MIRGFPPIAGPDARVLILGTAPSERSLLEGRYYAQPQNAFGRIMEALFAEGARLGYDERVEMLGTAGVAVWDVLHAADRVGSLDSAIVPETAVPNDIRGFLAEHPRVRSVYFNGAEAERLFGRHMGPALSESDLRLERLPSTSPANAAKSFDAKLEAWRAVQRAATG